MPRGEKICPKCDATAGPRLYQCPCGHKYHVKRPVPRVRGCIATPVTPVDDQDLSDTANVSIKLTDREAFKRFVQQLNRCYALSRKTGGCYAAFITHKTGTLRVEVWLHV